MGRSSGSRLGFFFGRTGAVSDGEIAQLAMTCNFKSHGHAALGKPGKLRLMPDSPTSTAHPARTDVIIVGAGFGFWARFCVVFLVGSVGVETV
jgi:hypothetical protein